ncbi:MAG: hypothetical protein HDS65_07250 [Bacteroidales bacterium]|nr:hypothetical protein [Bacteroidales bacterium]
MAAVLMSGTMAAFAAEPIVLEAEDYTYAVNMDDAPVGEGTEASGAMIGGTQGAVGSYLEMVGGEAGCYAQYIVEVPEAGTYDFTVFYASMFDRWLKVTANNQIGNVIYCDELSAGWDGTPREVLNEDETTTIEPGIVSKTIQLYLEAGENELKVEYMFGPSKAEGRDVPYIPNLDRFELVRSATEIAKPADWEPYTTYIREMETPDGRSGNTTIDDRENFSGGQAGCVGASGGTLIYNVNVDQAGVYDMTIWYCLFGNRWAKVKVNEGEPYLVQFNQWAAGEWFAANTHRNVLVYLEKGANTIQISNYTKVGANASSNGDTAPMDLFTLDLVNYPDFVKPANEIGAPKHALSSIAKWSSNTLDNVAAIQDHNEWTVATAASSTADVVLEFPFEILLTGYQWASENADRDGWTLEVSNDGRTWREGPTPGATATVGRFYSATLTDPFVTPDPVKYVRVNIKGSAAASIGDLAVWGYPYSSAATHNPEGILIPDGVEFNSDIEGYYAEGTDPDTGEVTIYDETTHNIFDGSNTSFWTPVCNNETLEVNVEFYLDEEVQLKSYLIAAPYRDGWSGRNPQYWTLAAYDYNSDEEDPYTTLDAQNEFVWHTIGGAFILPCDMDFTSDFIRLTLRETAGKTLHLSGLQLFTEDISGEAAGVIESAAVKPALALAILPGAIEFVAEAGTDYSIYTIAGATVAQGRAANGGNTVALAPGFYVVKVGNLVKKVSIR